MDLTLTVESPVHVGVDEERSTEEYVFDERRAYKLNLDRYFESNPAEIDAFVEDIENGRSMAEFFDRPSRHTSYVLETWVSEREIGNTPIQPFIKTRGEEPYIPGSSLKGTIRTALACQVMSEGATPDRLDRDGVEELFGLGGRRPQQDVLRCLTVRDATQSAVQETPLALCEIKTYSLKRGGEMKAKHYSTYAECLVPGTKLSTEISVDVAMLEEMIGEFGHRDVVDRLFGRELTAEAILDRIKTALARQGGQIAAEDRSLTGEFDEVESWYDEYEATAGTPLRTGFGTGWHSITVGLELSKGALFTVRADMDRGKPAKHDDCGGTIVADDNNPGKLFCRRCDVSGISPESPAVSVTPFPKTRRLINRNGTPKYPLGWLTMKPSA